MGIDFKINFQTKIKLNGKEYGSIEEVPSEHRHIVQDAVAAARNPFSHGKLTVNGVGYDKPEDMPPDVRRTYEEALQKARDMARRTGDDTPLPDPQPGLLNGAPVKESGLSGRTLVILLILIAAAFLMKYFSPK